MGRVYTAFDPDLDRKVALKVVEAREYDNPIDLSREARVLAKVEHPNVATVFDVGFWEKQLFIAMERVEGGDLEAWLKTPRAVSAVMRVLVHAGRGLLAAHERGVVHRDFKPSNVLVGDDGRVRVADFGLARLVAGDAAAPSPGDSMRGVFDSDQSVAGTPAYMAPELVDGAPATPGSDQYAFCVSAHWALCGTLPSEGSVAALPVKAEVRRAIARGLRREPADRFASIKDLLHALDQPSRRRRRWFLGGTAVGLLSGAAVVVFLAPNADDGCEERLTMWNERYPQSRRDALRDVLVSSPAAYAHNSADRVAVALRAFAGEWTEAFSEACGIDRAAVECLEVQEVRHEALWAALERAGADGIEHAAPAVARLPQPRACVADDEPPRTLANLVDADDPDAASEIVVHLDRSAAFRYTSQLDEAQREAEVAVAAAEALGHPPLMAEALVQRGLNESDIGDLGASRETLDAAVALAWRSRHDEAALVAIAALLWDVGQNGGELQAAEVWLKIGRATAERLVRPSEATADFWNAAGGQQRYAGRWAEARTSYERSLEQRRQLLRPEHPLIAQSLSNLAGLDLEEGRFERGLKLSGVALERLEDTLGAEHPATGQVRGGYGTALLRVGRFEEARDELLEALRVTRTGLGDGHPALAAMTNSLGVAYSQLGDDARALESYQRALKAFVAMRGPDDLKVGEAHSNIGSAAGVLGDNALAIEHSRRAIDVFRQALGETHPKVSAVRLGYADVLRRARRCEDAIVEATLALDVLDASSEQAGGRRALILVSLGRAQMCAGDEVASERSLGQAAQRGLEVFSATHPTMRAIYTYHAESLRRIGKVDEGLAQLDKALAIEGPPSAMASAWLTQALLLRDRDPRRALELAKQAREHMSKKNNYADKREAVRKLIAEL